MMLKNFVRIGNRFWSTFVRFSRWAVGHDLPNGPTGTVLCSEEHTITQILTGLGLEDQWRNVEHFAEYGSWDREAVERQLMRLVEQEHPARWGRYHPVAIDDTKEHRTSAEVWGTCTFHESGARSPNRATTVRAHNWVVMGDLVARQALDLPAAGVAVVLSQESIARRRAIPHQNGDGRGDVARGGRGIGSPDFGRV